MIWQVAVYLVAMIAVFLTVIVSMITRGLVQPLDFAEPIVISSMIGGIGGCLYCLRAIYLNACVHRQWSRQWLPWYFIRPITSVLSGGASYIFLFAGLLALDAAPTTKTSPFGFYAIAFIAGLNVDRFLSKIEDVARTTWGIDKSRAARFGDADKGEK